MSEISHCPFCGAADAAHFYTDRRRDYLRCGCCLLVFVPPKFHLTLEAERSEYDKHENAIFDTGYRKFLSRLSAPLLERLPASSCGLDFGCGPGPALAQMLRECGHQVALYDSYYASDPAVLDREYDFICATEVVEHLHQPGRELVSLWSMLRPGGYLGVMTKMVRDLQAFALWHYKNDPTHVCFFSRDTWQWWAAGHRARVTFIGSDVILLEKPVF